MPLINPNVIVLICTNWTRSRTGAPPNVYSWYGWVDHGPLRQPHAGKSHWGKAVSGAIKSCCVKGSSTPQGYTENTPSWVQVHPKIKGTRCQWPLRIRSWNQQKNWATWPLEIPRKHPNVVIKKTGKPMVLGPPETEETTTKNWHGTNKQENSVQTVWISLNSARCFLLCLCVTLLQSDGKPPPKELALKL